MKKKLTPEEKKVLQEKIREAGLDEERGKPAEVNLSDDEKEKMKEMIARAEQERLGRLDRLLHSRSRKKKKA